MSSITVRVRRPRKSIFRRPRSSIDVLVPLRNDLTLARLVEGNELVDRLRGNDDAGSVQGGVPGQALEPTVPTSTISLHLRIAGSPPA